MLPRRLAPVIDRLRRGRFLFLFVFFVFIPAVILAFLVSRSLAEKPETIDQKITAYLNRVGEVCRKMIFDAVLEKEGGVSRYLDDADPVREPTEVLQAACESSPICEEFFLFDSALNRQFPFGPSAVELPDIRELAFLPGDDRAFARKILEGERDEFSGEDLPLVLRKYREALSLSRSDLTAALALHLLGRVCFKARDYRAAVAYYRRLSELPGGRVSLGGISLRLVALLRLAEIERSLFNYDRSLEYCRQILEGLARGNLAGSVEEASFFARQASETAAALKDEGILDRAACQEIDRQDARWLHRQQTALRGERIQEAVRGEYARLLPYTGEKGDEPELKVFAGSVDGEEAIALIERLPEDISGGGTILGVILDPTQLQETVQEAIAAVMEAETDVNIIVRNGQGNEEARVGDPANGSRYRVVQSLSPLCRAGMSE